MPIPWYPWHPEAFRSDTRIRSLSFAQQGLYRALLDLMWVSPHCQVPADPDKLRSLLHVSFPNSYDRFWLRDLSIILASGLFRISKFMMIRSPRLRANKTKALLKSRLARKSALYRKAKIAHRPHTDRTPTAGVTHQSSEQKQQTVDSITQPLNGRLANA